MVHGRFVTNEGVLANEGILVAAEGEAWVGCGHGQGGGWLKAQVWFW